MMDKKQERKLHMDSIFVLLLFTVFALCLLGVLLTGSGIYQRLVERDERSYSARTAVQYIAAKVRQSDRAGGVRVGTFDGGEGSDTLFIYEEYDGERFVTRIYVCEGYIRELFTYEGDLFVPEDGEKILVSDPLSFSYEEDTGLLQISEEGTPVMTLFLRSGGGALS